MLTVTKSFKFCYGHRLPNYAGPCKRIHGHNSNVEVEFKQPAEAARTGYPGMVVDLRLIKEVVLPLVNCMDHQLLNDIPPFNEDMVPTAENIVEYLVGEIQKTWIGDGLVRVRVSETDDSYAEWKENI